MNEALEWLPPLTLLSDCGGDWDTYLQEVYLYFKSDFLDSGPYYQGARVHVRERPYHRGLEAGFWHITSQGKHEEERTPDFRRCERIRWARPSIEHSGEPCARVWTEKRPGDNRVHIWMEDVDYLVVLSVKGKRVTLVTTFTTIEDHQRRKFRRRYAEARKG